MQNESLKWFERSHQGPTANDSQMINKLLLTSVGSCGERVTSCVWKPRQVGGYKDYFRPKTESRIPEGLGTTIQNSSSLTITTKVPP